MVSQPDSGDAARLGELDLSQYSQAPYGVKVTPDGRTAVVTHSAGFFLVPGAAALLLGDSAMPTGPSKVLLVDLESRSVRSEIDVDDGAAGIAITHDGSGVRRRHARQFLARDVAQRIRAVGTVFDDKGRMLMTMPGNRELAVLDIRDGSAFTVPWFSEPGPMGIDLY